MRETDAPPPQHAALQRSRACTLPLAQHCRDALASLPPPGHSETAEGIADVLGWTDWALQPWNKLQNNICKRIAKKLHTALLGSLDAASEARFHSCAGPLAAAWQWASLRNAGETIDDGDYRSTARELLGQPVAMPGCTCQNRTRTGPSACQPCGEPLCAYARHAYRCSRGGGLKARSVDVENVLVSIHEECGYTVARHVHIPEPIRWKSHCGPCNSRGITWDLPGAPCDVCGASTELELEEAIPDLDARSARVPRALLDATAKTCLAATRSSLLLLAAPAPSTAQPS